MQSVVWSLSSSALDWAAVSGGAALGLTSNAQSLERLTVIDDSEEDSPVLSADRRRVAFAGVLGTATLVGVIDPEAPAPRPDHFGIESGTSAVRSRGAPRGRGTRRRRPARSTG